VHAGSREQLEELLALLNSHDLVERGVDRLGERSRPEQLAGSFDLVEVDLERGLSDGGGS
jgi:hypothetical protein